MGIFFLTQSCIPSACGMIFLTEERFMKITNFQVYEMKKVFLQRKDNKKMYICRAKKK
jgi:hypothetical protein